MQGTILVATAGQAVLRSSDDGRTWHRLGLGQDIEFDAVVRCLAVHPQQPNVVYAGADAGLVRSDDAGATWHRVVSPFDGRTVWSLAIDPTDPDFIVVGTGAPSRAAMYRTTDSGATWDRLPPEIPEFCAGVSRPRILTATVDRHDPKNLWFGVEEGGLWRSGDRGDTWTRIDGTPASLPRGVTNSDIHCVVVLGGPPRTIVVAVVNALFVSQDDGQTWTRTDTREEWGIYYTRLIKQLPGTDDLLLGIGDATPGTLTRIFRSTDLARTWQESTLDTPANSTVWAFGVHPADPLLAFAGTKYGHLFRSTDAGRTWSKEWREFSEITDVAWTPAVAPAPEGH
ncbi:WD40/YVTN/BNR-like repeat-containing protein [Streptomyces griseiscabiei]|uniref:Glycosyl hydrolase n=1 Tax=Streptomyces griseiscabiei TaxID=2993540 RepID=A0ABU4L6G5_9ACTN|nr:glycosyl hydrolase [Streptomyces griseiscabiei]MBZ3906340.1 glycosyl hydrolase [Streptomyces griseiscabiei]MDX2911337.1 glycosyl hydrolase [Streptomyces griseiscabiei]